MMLTLLLARERRRSHGEAGMTLVEVMVVSAVLGIVTLIFTAAMARVQTSLTRAQERSDNNDQARIALQRLDREIRSGNILYDPASETPAYYSLRVYTQANASTRSTGNLCVQWLIDDTELLRRTWPPGEPQNASGWGVVVTGVRNVEQSVHAFELDPDPNKGGRTVTVKLLVDVNPGPTPDQTVRLETAITGRNSTFGYPTSACSTTPG